MLRRLFQYPANNWDGPGLCIEDGAARIDFYARGEVGGEVVGFDAVGASIQTVLSTTWNAYSIDLSGIDYNHVTPAGGVAGAFSVVLHREESDLTPKVLHVDRIRWMPAGE